MITQAEIQAISQDLTECQVRIPLFESVYDNAPKIINAKFMFQPGICNGYSVNDAVWVAFDRDMASLPVVLGKIYKGTQNVVTTANSALIGDSLIISNSASIPAETVFSGAIPADYNSVLKLYNKIHTLEQNTGSINDGKSLILKRKSSQLTIELTGFTTDDVNKKIVLLRTSKHTSNVRGYRHPANYNSNYFNMTTASGVTKFGYGNIANCYIPGSQTKEKFIAVPSFMPNNGFAQTEWTLTINEIMAGKVIIDLNQLLLPLLMYSKQTDGTIVWDSLLGIGKKLGTMKIKFGLAEKYSSVIEQTAIGTLCLGVRNLNSGSLLINNKIDFGRLYISIK